MRLNNEELKRLLPWIIPVFAILLILLMVAISSNSNVTKDNTSRPGSSMPTLLPEQEQACLEAYDTGVIFFDNEKYIEAIEEFNKVIIGSIKHEDATVKKAEAQRLYDSFMALQNKIQDAKSIIQVTRCNVSNPDSASGVSLYFNFVNRSDKTINYVNFGVTFYNAVGDIVTCPIKRDIVNKCKDTGPFAPGKGFSGTGSYWGKYYNSTIKRAELVSLSVDFDDGTTYIFEKDVLPYVQY